MSAHFDHLAGDAARILDSLRPLPPSRPPRRATVWSRPALAVVAGLPGSGKSRFCRDLAGRTPAAVLESDALRKLLFRRPVYSWAESARLFAAIHVVIERLLGDGISVILDATNLRERHRQPLYAIAEKLGAKLVVVEIVAPPEVVLTRLAERTAADSSSDADVAVYLRMREEWEEIGREHIVVDTSRPTARLITAVSRLMNDP